LTIAELHNTSSNIGKGLWQNAKNKILNSTKTLILSAILRYTGCLITLSNDSNDNNNFFYF